MMLFCWSYVVVNDGAAVLEPRQVTSGSVDQHNIRVRGVSTPQRREFDLAPTGGGFELRQTRQRRSKAVRGSCLSNWKRLHGCPLTTLGAEGVWEVRRPADVFSCLLLLVLFVVSAGTCLAPHVFKSGLKRPSRRAHHGTTQSTQGGGRDDREGEDGEEREGERERGRGASQ
ncbi:hypothetical protein E2C01_065832 [Portunus trituberculatus]|uniref:Uncharacterized protein n=1 Tax=Portunus trituberculatus TaxID=210409 RepID=A0A5B7HSX1_PORTR|nr:hypothetical protein [Portunus trituberculatus]